MSHSHDMHHEPHNEQYPSPSMTDHDACNKHNPINILNNNYTIYVKQGIRSDMGKIRGDKISTRDKNDDLEMNEVQVQV